ncbi:hypothetical protein, partial [Ralstonia pseudosolanacearum]|uniref:hypothetical protein n=1 Tax=Ralstonia pseudosolanacearum TaxID=1310165 RepID=UPI003221B6F8
MLVTGRAVAYTGEARGWQAICMGGARCFCSPCSVPAVPQSPNEENHERPIRTGRRPAAALKRPPILVFDEATSALDSRTE